MTRKQFIALCEKHRIEVEIDDRDRYAIEAPYGYVLAATGAHETVIYWNDSWKTAEIYDQLATDVVHGIERCTIQDCDWCG